MKRLIVMALAAGGLAVGSLASAQDLGAVITNILGFGSPGYTTSNPAVVAGTGVYVDPDGRQVYTVPNGTARQVYVDPDGRQVYVQPNTNYGITGYDAWGRPIYGNNVYGNNAYRNYAQANRRDRDGDGVINRYDRYPDDPRYR
ncbi:hypothetical protein GCM10028796_33260 [Ramlibacter monticola]|uniref:Uncharacterized protein n=1 Tax=Ramlibacter monticola TaxID=1926872 RepID=A0A936Z4U3_9BURK|nr:hypothetical protein [Ramlibacter monticola]MBL0394101.1 hypothetical protein [Ramlibacter monticola]